MIKIFNKKQQKELKKPRFLPQSDIKHETEIAAGQLQEKLTENQRVERSNKALIEINDRLTNEHITLRMVNSQLAFDIEKTKKSLSSINELISVRDQTLRLMNEALVKISNKNSSKTAEFIKEAQKVAKMVDQFNVLYAEYTNLILRTDKLNKQRKAEESAIIEAQKENKEIKAENRKKKEEYEKYKTIESKTIARMKFYGDRINRFYTERQMKPPIELPF